MYNKINFRPSSGEILNRFLMDLFRFSVSYFISTLLFHTTTSICQYIRLTNFGGNEDEKI